MVGRHVSLKKHVLLPISSANMSANICASSDTIVANCPIVELLMINTI